MRKENSEQREKKTSKIRKSRRKRRRSHAEKSTRDAREREPGRGGRGSKQTSGPIDGMAQSSRRSDEVNSECPTSRRCSIEKHKRQNNLDQSGRMAFGENNIQESHLSDDYARFWNLEGGNAPESPSAAMPEGVIAAKVGG